ncbi:uncharacterized protein LOC141649167 [Silene latifolia]|uniref:uncharacterized protein LOC141649167 n=1 Tax=Silene latifolia TaxID=37657 RepID=UPI003D782201
MAHWLTEGDMNSTYFHGLIRTRRNKNFIQQIKDHINKLCTDKEGIQMAFLDYYHMLLGSSNPTTKDILFQIPNDKASGPDGYSRKFFKDTWETIGDETDRPATVLQYRPIACCNVVYKCISKVLCTRLAAILPELISPNQGGFIKGRSILNNILICQDIINLYKRQAVSPRYDLLLFCKGDVQSMMILIRTFATFSKSSGLNMSKGKSNVYFNGVASEVKADIMQILGLVEGILPFRYLGVPIKTTRLSAQDCKSLIDKLVGRIRGLGVRKLSYARRLILITSVLKTLHNYWAQMFILPMWVITRI